MNQPTPAIVTQSAARRLPRVALLLLCAAYLLPGLVGRGPWKSADVAAFGYMAALAEGGAGLARWFDPHLLGLRPEIPALLPYWLGAWAIQWMPWLRPDLAVRVVFALMLWGTFSATWYAVYYLARTPRAQPVAFAFGGEARPTDYARAIADGGLLALIACLGLAQLGHETTPALAQLFFVSCLFYGAAALPYRRAAPMIAFGVGSLGLALSGAPALGLASGAGLLALALRERRLRPQEPDGGDHPAPTYSIPAIATMAAWLLAALAVAAALHQLHWRLAWPGAQPGASAAAEWRSLLKLLVWFTWPAWPLALWTLWRWRLQLTARHVAVPLWLVLVVMFSTLFTGSSDRSLLLGLPALATLAAFALPTFRRSVSALIDWFTLLFFSGCALFIWVYWISLHTGVPAKPAANVAKLAPGFTPEFSGLAFLFAAAGTVAWIALVRWRTGRHRAALWKTLVMPAGGAALCWLLLMTLWLPLLDYARSYAPQVGAIAARIGKPACVAELGLSRAHIAALRHHGRFPLQPVNSHSTCGWLLVSPEALPTLHLIVSLEQWRFAGTFRRPTSPSDDLLLFEHVAKAP
ncbi:hypothetical protein [Xenophilus azovorans]|uniref:hypothetical protein n=1 Tax=Xenophilus azovorans TaxID=151755 RepID=UPI00057160F1|nr:hypothetical protein [Xenophilus azovorans]